MSKKFQGYASVFNMVDNHNDIIKKGAFKNSIKKHQSLSQTGGQKIKLLWQHKQEEVIGKIDFLKEDEKGLFIKASLFEEVKKAKEVQKLISSGSVVGLSIGFRPVEYHFNEEGIRVITKLDLYEISVVTFPANESSHILELKMIQPQQEREHNDEDISKLDEAIQRAIKVLG